MQHRKDFDTLSKMIQGNLDQLLKLKKKISSIQVGNRRLLYQPPRKNYF